MSEKAVWIGIALVAGCLAGMLAFTLAFFLWRKREGKRIEELTAYLEKVNTGDTGALFQEREDDFSRLQDEIYKTVTELYQTRDMAVAAKNNFAANLSNIAHQIKTPITSISLSLQMMQEYYTEKRSVPTGSQSGFHDVGEARCFAPFGIKEISIYAEHIRLQLSRLTHLEEALLLLSRIDAGTLSLERKKIDIFTLLELSADSLRELFQESGVLLEIEEAGEVGIQADMDWTMEAVMNLLKNCMEHTPPGGTVCCRYEQNPLYTQIRITDTGTGFAKEDIPRLFERFYRGKHAKKDGIGIGLALSKAIIESQNGTITARNLPEGGACFEIHFYSH